MCGEFLPQRDLSGLIAADGIHLTMAGYRCLFDTLADWVRTAIIYVSILKGDAL